jgi:transcriptional regulator with XRE-family HTH domain
MTTQELGRVLLIARTIKGLSQSNMADDLDMTPQGYGKIERGNVSVDWAKLHTICQILGFKDIFQLQKWHDQIQSIGVPS